MSETELWSLDHLRNCLEEALVEIDKLQGVQCEGVPIRQKPMRYTDPNMQPPMDIEVADLMETIAKANIRDEFDLYMEIKHRWNDRKNDGQYSQVPAFATVLSILRNPDYTNWVWVRKDPSKWSRILVLRKIRELNRIIRGIYGDSQEEETARQDIGPEDGKVGFPKSMPLPRITGTNP